MNLHIQKRGEVNRDTKTLCGKKLEDLPRMDGSVSFKNHDNATCFTCRDIAESIVRMTEIGNRR